MSTNEWQPIETAPKDGTRVMLYDPGFGKVEIGHWQLFASRVRQGSRGAWATGYHCADNGAIKIGHPTHWRPLPEIPA